jgi:anti-sigma regulatory factor (Ser/Thr protein kinase)
MRSVSHNLSLTVRAEPESVPRTRHALSQFAVEAGADRAKVEAVQLASSEALTNAVLHAYGEEPGRVCVTAALVADELWVLIADDGRGLEPRTDRPGLGLGLGLISQVTDELAIVPRAGGGTEVRMRFDLIRSSRVGMNRSDAPRTACSSGAEHGGGQKRAAHFRGHQQYA